MVRLVIGAAIAYAAYRIGRELVNDVPEIERGPNAADFPNDRPQRAKPNRSRPRDSAAQSG